MFRLDVFDRFRLKFLDGDVRQVLLVGFDVGLAHRSQSLVPAGSMVNRLTWFVFALQTPLLGLFDFLKS